MTANRRRMVLWGILLCSTLFTTYTWWPTGTGRGASATTTAPAASPAAAPAAGATAAAGAATAPEAPPLTREDLSAWRSHLSAVRRDPFFTMAELDAMDRPPLVVETPGAPPAPAPAYTVKFVMTVGADRHALVDRQVVTVGDMLGSERVAEIVSDAVVLERDGRRRRLPVAAASPSAIQIRREPQ